MRSWPSPRHVRRAVYLAAALTVLVVAAGASPGSAGALSTARHHDTVPHHDSVPTDQPLPGYTISNPPLAPALVGGVATTVWQGVHEHGGYIVEVPPHWNGDLVMWAHGYRGQGFVLTVD